jgi:PKD repeat protein
MACDNLSMVFTVSNLTPTVNETVSCSASVTNNGTTIESYHIIFSANGVEFGRSGVITIDPGNVHSTTMFFNPVAEGSVVICADLVCDTIPAGEAPVADFTADPLSGASPLGVQFTNLSTGTPPLAHLWDMDEETSFDVVSEHPHWTFYEEDGASRTISLTVTNAYGINTMTKTDYINMGGVVPSAPVANFSATPSYGTPPLTVQFTNASTGATPMTYAWAFGDGGTSTLASPSHTYTSVGNYTVVLIATNVDGSNTMTKNGYITVSTVTPSEYGCGTVYQGYTIGGGAAITGSSDYPIPTPTTGKTVPSATYTALRDTIESATSGQVVYIPGTYTINMSGQPAINVPAGVTVSSDRGRSGSLGALIIKNTNATSGWEETTFSVRGNNVRFTGLRMEGEMFPVLPSPSDYQKSQSLYLVGIKSYDNTGLVVDNCELRGYAWACILVMNLNSPGANAAHIHHNYIHYTLARSEGYGIEIASGYALIEGNVFNNNRHSVAGAGTSGESYDFRFNHQLGQGTAWYGHWVDVHSNDGEMYNIYNNTFENNPEWCAIGIQEGGSPAVRNIYKNRFNYTSIKPIQLWGSTVNTNIYDNYLNNTLITGFDSRLYYNY